MWRTNYKWVIVFIAYWVLSSFSCEEYTQTYYEFHVSTAPSAYKDAFYIFFIINELELIDEYETIPTGEDRSYKIFQESYYGLNVNYGFSDCDSEFYKHASFNEKHLNGRPYKNLLEIQLLNPNPNKYVSYEINGPNCNGAKFRLNAAKEINVLPVKPDTLNRIIIYQDRTIALDTVMNIEDTVQRLVIK